MNMQPHLVRRELDAVYEVSKTLATSLDVHKTFREALNYLLHAFDWRRTFVVVADAENRLSGMCAIGLTQAEQQRLHFESGEGIVGHVFTSGVPATVPDVRAEPLFLNRTGGADQSPGIPVAMLATPIRADHRTLGVLVIDCLNPEERRVFADDLRLLRMVATLMGQALLLHRSVTAAHETLQDETRRMHKALGGQRAKIEQVVGVSAPMLTVFEQIEQVAPSRTTVLLRGESGTGKEVIARAIHSLSPRKGEAFVGVNCAALTESLLESELFGHEKGAFTGAVGQRKGRFELAHGGTLFLDEIGDISASFQAKLLRVLQEGELERIGGARTITVDVRVIAATHRDLESDVESGKFREDLYYRLNVMPIHVPALRERMEDIPEIAHFLIGKIGRGQGRELKITESALRVLQHHDWPGNVRELENCLERAAVMCDSGVIDREQVLMTGMEEGMGRGASASTPSSASLASERHSAMPELDDPDMDERERVIAALEQSGWVQAKAARLLDMTPRQIAYRIKILDIKVRQF